TYCPLRKDTGLSALLSEWKGSMSIVREEKSSASLGEGEAKVYNSIRVRLSVLSMALNFVLLLIFSFTPVSRSIVNEIEFYFYNPYLQFFLFLCFAGGIVLAVDLLFDYYGGYFIEHEFGLSNQDHRRWLREQIKSLLLGAVIGFPLLMIFFFLIRALGAHWWWVFALVIFTASVLLARAAPAVIFPLFYSFSKIQQGDLRNRILALLEKENIPSCEIYSFNMSKNTRKANAGFTGIGRSRRIILSDTLLENFSPDEVEVIFAHELGHLKGRHIIKNVVLSGLIIFGSFFLCGLVYEKTLFSIGYINLYDIAALPALLLYLSVFGFLIMPATNAVSRAFEREADGYAIRSTGRADAFISGMEKLGAINLADADPHPCVEFFFHGHPSLSKRISFARRITSGE
ncbi:MAG: M48 family metallopeptidase, partial [Spirochaetota bacterium]